MAVAHLALVPYEPDTVVADPEGSEMQVKLPDEDGVQRWHRFLPGAGGTMTACGDPIDLHMMLGQRASTLEGVMCPDCFTAYELVKAELANRAARRNR